MKKAVIKIGGALVQHKASMNTFWHSVKRLQEEMQVVIVHGGGPQATSMARRLDHEPTIIEGRRVTSDLDLSIMQWVLYGELNTALVTQALAQQLPAIGLKGVDARLIQVNKRPPWKINGTEVDFGHVGDIVQVKTDALELLLSNMYLPIVTPLGIDAECKVYNVNADTVALHIAMALQADLFLLVTESGGVRKNRDIDASLISKIDSGEFEAGKNEGWIRDGMIVKLNVAFEAQRSGISEVYITKPADMYTRLEGTRVL